MDNVVRYRSYERLHQHQRAGTFLLATPTTKCKDSEHHIGFNCTEHTDPAVELYRVQNIKRIVWKKCRQPGHVR